MKISEMALPGVLCVEPQVFGDARGFFLETYRADLFADWGIPAFVQDNHSRSRRGVLRGLHYQLHQPQGKLVRVTSGRVFDVAVDVRRGSPHFGRWVGMELNDESLCQMYIPPGFAHGFVVLSEIADFVYKCTDYYHPQSEYGVAWNDPAIEIEWPLSEITAVSLSVKDQHNPRLHEQMYLPDYSVTP